MANYQQFEQDYPTLNKFVGAAREAASVMPGAGYFTPQGQDYQDARTRFQQQNPNAALAGKALGLGVDAAAVVGGAGSALGALGRAATRAAMPQAVESAAAGRSIFAPQIIEQMAQNAPRFITPTPGNLMAGARQAGSMMASAPTLSAAVGGGAIGAGLGSLPNRGAGFNQQRKDQQEAAARPLMDMEAQVHAARPDDTPDQHLQRMRLLNFMNARPGMAAQNIPSQAPHPMQDLSQHDQMIHELQTRQSGAAAQNGVYGGPAAKPRPNLATLERLRRVFAPHYTSATDDIMRQQNNLAMAIMQQRLNDPNVTPEEREAARQKYQQDAMAILGKGSGMAGVMTAMQNAAGVQQPSHYE